MTKCCKRKSQPARGFKKIPRKLASLVQLDYYHKLCRHQQRQYLIGIKHSMVKVATEAHQKGYDKARVKVDIEAYQRGRQDERPLAERAGYERGVAETTALTEPKPCQCNVNTTEAELEQARLQGIREAIATMKILPLCANFGFPVIRFVGMQYYGHHRFHPSDHVQLKLEYKSINGDPAVMVLVRKNGEMVRAASVLREDAAILKKIPGFTNAPLSFLYTTQTKGTTGYRISFPDILV